MGGNHANVGEDHGEIDWRLLYWLLQVPSLVRPSLSAGGPSLEVQSQRFLSAPFSCLAQMLLLGAFGCLMLFGGFCASATWHLLRVSIEGAVSCAHTCPFH